MFLGFSYESKGKILGGKHTTRIQTGLTDSYQVIDSI